MNPLESRKFRRFVAVTAIAVGLVGLAGCTQSFPHPELSLPFSQNEQVQTPSAPTSEPLFQADQEFLVQGIEPVSLSIPTREGYQGDIIPGTVLFIKPETVHLQGLQWDKKTNPYSTVSQETAMVGVGQIDYANKKKMPALVFAERHALIPNPRNPGTLQLDPKHPAFFYTPNDPHVELDWETVDTLRQGHFGGSKFEIQNRLDLADLTTGVGYVKLNTDQSGKTILVAPGGPLGTDLRIPIPGDELGAFEVYRAEQTPFAEAAKTIQAQDFTATPSPTLATDTPTVQLSPQAAETAKRIQNTEQAENTPEPTRKPVTQVTPPATIIAADGSVWQLNKEKGIYDRIATAPAGQQEKKPISPTATSTTTSTMVPMQTTTSLPPSAATQPKPVLTEPSKDQNPLTSTPAIALYAALGLGAVGYSIRYMRGRKEAKVVAAWNKKVEDRTDRLMGFSQHKAKLETLMQLPREHQIKLLMDIAQLSEDAEKKEKAGHLMEAIQLKKQREQLFKAVDATNATIKQIEADYRTGLRKEAERELYNIQKKLANKTI